jgi:hypothetical protein
VLLRSGDSAGAIRLLAKARALNPWNDVFKDSYVKAVRIFARTTKDYLDRGDCEGAVARARFLGEVAPDMVSVIADVRERCPGLDLRADLRGFEEPESAKEKNRHLFAHIGEETERTARGNTDTPIARFYQMYFEMLRQRMRIRPRKSHADLRTAFGDHAFVYVPMEMSFRRLASETEAKQECVRTKNLLEVAGSGLYIECVFGPRGSSRAFIELNEPTKDALLPLHGSVHFAVRVRSKSGREETREAELRYQVSPIEIHLDALYPREEPAEIDVLKRGAPPAGFAALIPTDAFGENQLDKVCPECIGAGEPPDAILALSLSRAAVGDLDEIAVSIDVGANVKHALEGRSK